MKKFADFDIVGHFRVFAVISVLLVVTGLVGLILTPFGINLFNFDIDFLGGVTMEFSLGAQVDSSVTAEVRDIVHDVTGEYPSSVVKAGDDGKSVNIKMVEISSEMREAVGSALEQRFGAGNVELESSDFVSSTVGEDLRRAAVISSVVAAAAILVYITIRFELRSGLAAVCCLIHDLLVMLSMYIIFRIPFNMNFIAAALTILGYSINATIVVFDRVRENHRAVGAKGDFAEITNRSIHQTMTRSINTTLTTALPVILIIILGVSSIRNFAWPLLIGIISGTYSSVFLAGPLWVIFRGKKKPQ